MENFSQNSSADSENKAREKYVVLLTLEKKKKAFSFLSKASSGIFRALEEGLEICLGENCFSSNEFCVYLCELSQV